MLTQNAPVIAPAIRTETTHMGTQVFLGSILLGTIDTYPVWGLDAGYDSMLDDNDIGRLNDRIVMVLQSLVIFLAVNTPADDEGLSSFFDVHKNVGRFVGQQNSQTHQNSTLFSGIYTQKLGC